MYFVGLDLRQRQDFTAVAVVERKEWLAGKRLALRHLERMPLGTAYTKAVERVCKIMGHLEIQAGGRLVVDATGVGAAGGGHAAVGGALRAAERGHDQGSGAGARRRGTVAGSSEGFAGGVGGAARDRGAEDREKAGGGGTAGARADEHPV